MTKVVHKRIENRKIYLVLLLSIFILNTGFVIFSIKVQEFSLPLYILVEILTFLMFYYGFYDLIVILSSHRFRIRDKEWHLIHETVSSKRFILFLIIVILNIILLNIQTLSIIMILLNRSIGAITLVYALMFSIFVMFVLNLYFCYELFLIYLNHNKRYMNSWIFNHSVGKKSFFSFMLALLCLSTLWGVILLIYVIIELMGGHKTIEDGAEIEVIE